MKPIIDRLVGGQIEISQIREKNPTLSEVELQNMEAHLKSCPFCGKKAFVDKWIGDNESWFAGCGCGQGFIAVDKKKAIKAWNRRVEG